MKRLILVGMMAASLMFATSCQNEEIADGGKLATVSFSVGTPEITSRAYSDGMTATVLQYAVYDEAGEILPALTVNKAEIKGSTTVNLQLTTGNKYSVIFWAAAQDAPYAVDFENKKMTVDYTGAKSNDESRDAFYKYHTFTVTGAQTETIELKRPFAQLNIGTNDYEASTKAGYTPTQSAVTVKNIYSTLDLVKGDVSNEIAVEFELADIKKDETFPVAGYEYLAMNYLLVGNDKETVEIEFTYADANNVAKTRTVGSVPVQRNYRTNIYGQLLTSDVDVNVEIKPDYEKPDYEVLVWDGKSDTSWYNDTDTEFTLTNPQQVAGLSELVDAGNTFEGKTVKLDVDVYLYKKDNNGEAICFDPIGSYRFDKVFKGTFDGQNHTISGLNQNTWALNNGYYYNDCGLGLFGAVQEATVKNLKIDKASISGESGLCGIVAAVAENVTFENITVTNSNCADYQYYSGGIVGWLSGDNNKFVNCNVDATTTIAAQWGDFDNSTGGLIGGVGGSAKIDMKDCTVACRIDAYNDVTSSYQWYAYRRCGMLIGNSGKTETKDGRTYAIAPQLTCENVTVIYGDWMNYTYCAFAGTSWPYVRVQAGVSNSAYSNPRYGHPTDANGNKVVDDNHAHNDGEAHHLLCKFDQLYGGGQGVYGTSTHDGVKIEYLASYRKEVSSVAALTEALGKGLSVILEEDIDFGSTQLAITGENQVVDLGGHALTTANNWGGISLKNGATIKNGTITHAGNTAAIKAFAGSSVENVTINATCATADKTVTGIAVQQGANVESIKNVTINGVSQGIEVGYQATVGLIENAVVNESNNGTAKGIGLVINGGKVGMAKDCTFKGETYGITMHLKGVFDAGLTLENCKVEGATASIYAWDEKGISNISGSLTLTYDARTTLTGPFVWDFEDECKSVVTLNKPQ